MRENNCLTTITIGRVRIERTKKKYEDDHTTNTEGLLYGEKVSFAMIIIPSPRSLAPPRLKVSIMRPCNILYAQNRNK